MISIILALLAFYVWGDLRVALYIGLGFLIAKALLNSRK